MAYFWLSQVLGSYLRSVALVRVFEEVAAWSLESALYALLPLESESESGSESELPLLVLDRRLAGRRCPLFLAIMGSSTRGVEEVVRM